MTLPEIGLGELRDVGAFAVLTLLVLRIGAWLRRQGDRVVEATLLTLTSMREFIQSLPRQLAEQNANLLKEMQESRHDTRDAVQGAVSGWGDNILQRFDDFEKTQAKRDELFEQRLDEILRRQSK